MENSTNNWTDIISIVSILGTWVTIVLVYFTLQEMRNQRKASQKPELIIPIAPIFGYAQDNDIFVAGSWSNKERKNESAVVEERPQVTIYNIGAGAAKEINIKWDFDLSGTVKSIQDYCYHNSLPVVVNIQEDILKIESKGRESYISIEAYSKAEHVYLMPASVTAKGLKSSIPVTFLELLSILIFLDIHQTHKKSSNKPLLPVEESRFEIPMLFCELSYVDIGGVRYAKKFDVIFHPSMVMGIPSRKIELSSTEPVFHGWFEFREKFE